MAAPAIEGEPHTPATPPDTPGSVPWWSAAGPADNPEPVDSVGVDGDGDEEGVDAVAEPADGIDVAALRSIELGGAASDAHGAAPAGVMLLPATGRNLLLVAPHDAHPDMPRIADALRGRGYPVTCIAPEDYEDLARALKAQPVRLVVMHVGLLETIELQQMVQLRREHGATHWVLAWHSQSPRWVELVVYLQARGCIDCDDPRSFGRAIDSVIAGDLWFPRWLTHALYFTLLTAVRAARVDAAQSLGDATTALTKREAETLELMRQGLTNKEIARRLLVSVNTVKKHLKNAFDKRGLHSRRQGIC